MHLHKITRETQMDSVLKLKISTLGPGNYIQILVSETPIEIHFSTFWHFFSLVHLINSNKML